MSITQNSKAWNKEITFNTLSFSRLDYVLRNICMVTLYPYGHSHCVTKDYKSCKYCNCVINGAILKHHNHAFLPL